MLFIIGTHIITQKDMLFPNLSPPSSTKTNKKPSQKDFQLVADKKVQLFIYH